MEAAPLEFAGGTVRIASLSKAVTELDDVLMPGVLSVSPEVEAEMSIEVLEWQGVPLRTVNRASLVRLKMLRGSPQDLADVEKLK